MLFLIALTVCTGAVLGAAPALADPAVPVADPASPPPVGPPPVPEIPNPVYGSGDGPLGFLRDAWHTARDPYGLTEAPGQAVGTAPPAGAGPAPALPPGYTSINAPESSTPAVDPGVRPAVAGPPPPPGYYPLTGPPPPGYYDPPPPAMPPMPIPPPGTTP
ncbi:hypothetical protein LV457_02485 [Mycobacterium sp. MYCO198283]|uniref:hypothetical protein n=1 Tax=Mycobacterium sp. MYCO198283 TaxID=2883505 RepID=UPI001E5CFFD1|nr:hypothetical protein [Mycobacterium sp. MYCO198283]MCG5431161.1 hypothetical protein [Mycobacterium sp. MYCO198283]